MVFDGYKSGPSTKDETHQRRTSSQLNIGAEVNSKPADHEEKNHSKDKQKFLYFIGSELDKTGIKVQHSTSDVDCNVVSTACTMVKRRSVTIVGDDTDLLVPMLHHLSPSHHDIFLQPASKIINNRTLQDHVNSDVTAFLFFYTHSQAATLHPDNGIGKVMAMGKCDKDQTSAFLTPNQSHDNVKKHGLASLE